MKKQKEKVYGQISTAKSYVGNHPRPEGRKLEYDNAELQRWANDVCLPKLSELSDELAMRYNQKKHRNRNWKNELPRV